MSESFAIVGLGQLGRLLGAGLLASGHEVFPIQRNTAPALREARLARADRVLVAVGEDDLNAVLTSLPVSLRQGRTWLLQNELLPPVWQQADITSPTVLVVWSEKKRGKPVSAVQTTLVAGPDSALAVRACSEAEVPARAIEDAELTDALIDKNLYILVSNFAGLSVGGTVGALSSEHRTLMTTLADEILRVEGARLGRDLRPAPFIDRLEAAFAADPQHGCRGRSAEARLARTLAHARRLNLAAPALERLAKI